MNIDKYLVTYKTVKDMNLQELISFTDRMFQQYDINFYVSNKKELVKTTYFIIGHDKVKLESDYSYEDAVTDLIHTYSGIHTFLQEKYLSQGILENIQISEEKEEYIDITESLALGNVNMIKYYPSFDKVVLLINNLEDPSKPLVGRMSLSHYEQLLIDERVSLQSILSVIKRGKEMRSKYPFARLLALGFTFGQSLMFFNLVGENINNLEDEDIFNLLKLKETLKGIKEAIDSVNVLDDIKTVMEELSNYNQQCEYIKYKLQGHKD
jgi:hypothetical protein